MDSLTASHGCYIYTGNMNYTPADSFEFYEDAGIPNAATLAPMFQGNLTPTTVSPGTNFYGFYGSGMSYSSIVFVVSIGLMKLCCVQWPGAVRNPCSNYICAACCQAARIALGESLCQMARTVQLVDRCSMLFVVAAIFRVPCSFRAIPLTIIHAAPECLFAHELGFISGWP